MMIMKLTTKKEKKFNMHRAKIINIYFRGEKQKIGVFSDFTDDIKKQL